MNALEAAALLRDMMKDDPTMERAVMTTVRRAGFDNVYDWADHDPKTVISIAEGFKMTSGQIDQMTAEIDHHGHKK